MDLYLKAAVGWHLSDSLSTAGILKAVEKAKAARRLESPIIIYSDREPQYVSKKYIKATYADSFIRSYFKKGNPWDNAVIESFHALIKGEWLKRFVVKHLSHAHKLIFEYIEGFYNPTRIHSHCMMKSMRKLMLFNRM